MTAISSEVFRKSFSGDPPESSGVGAEAACPEASVGKGAAEDGLDDTADGAEATVALEDAADDDAAVVDPTGVPPRTSRGAEALQRGVSSQRSTTATVTATYLGRVFKSPQPEHPADHMNHGQKTVCKLFEAGGNSSEMLKTIEKHFHEMPLAIHMQIV